MREGSLSGSKEREKMSFPKIVGERPVVSSEPNEKKPRDLAALASELKRRYAQWPPRGYVRGKTQLRNSVMALYHTSAMRAERLVDQMQARGYIRYDGDPARLEKPPSAWHIETRPLTHVDR